MKRIRGFCLGFLIVILLFPYGVWATTYYVDATNGNDNNDGFSPSTAWKTIAKVNNSSFYPGDQILFKRGQIWREQLMVLSSGEPGYPITIDAYGSGSEPIISASDIVTGWEQYGVAESDIWRTNIAIQPRLVFFDGIKGRKENDKGSLNSEKEWYWNSNVLYVYSSSVPDTAYTNPGIEVHQRNFSIRIDNNNYINIENLNIKHAMDTILLNNADYCNLNGNTITQSSNGINLVDGSSYNILENNTISYMYYEPGYADGGGIAMSNGACTGNVIRNNEISYTDQYAIGWISLSNNIEVLGNKIHHVGQYASAPEPSAIVAYGTDSIVEKNSISDCGDIGIWVSGDRNQIRRNLIYNNSFGVYFTSAVDSPNLYNNVICNNNRGVVISGSSTNVNLKNNIIVDNEHYQIQVNSGSTTGFDSNYNCIYKTGSDVVFLLEEKVTNFSQWRASGYDAYSISEDPLFVDTLNAEFYLKGSSPCIDAGTFVGLPFNGPGPDIGAFEYQIDYGPPDPPTGLKVL